MSAIGLTGWAADELMSRRNTWLAWPAIFALFGAIAPALRAARAAASRRARAAGRHHRRRPRRPDRRHRLPVFVLRDGAGHGRRRWRRADFAAAGVRTAAGARAWPACSGRRGSRAGRRWSAHLPPARVRRDRRLRDADAEQLRNRPRAVSQRVRLRLRLDPAVCVLPVGGDDGAGLGVRRLAGGRSATSWTGRVPG